MEGPNYQNYSNKALLEAFESIDRETYPERFSSLSAIMREKDLLVDTPEGLQITNSALEEAYGPQVESEPRPSYTCEPPTPQYCDEGNYIPNEVPFNKRALNTIVALGIIVYGSYGLYVDELWVPLAKKLVVALSGLSAVVMSVAIVFAAAVLIVEIADHYDKRDNELTYYKAVRFCRAAGYGSFGTAVLVALVTGDFYFV